LLGCRLARGAGCESCGRRRVANPPQDDILPHKLWQDKLWQDKLWQDKLWQDKLWQDKLSQDKLWQDKLCQDKLWQDNHGIAREGEVTAVLVDYIHLRYVLAAGDPG